MSDARRRKNRLQIILIGVIFGGPLLVSILMYSTGLWQPSGSSNHGALLEPIVSLADELPASSLLAINKKKWLLVYVASGPCEQDCEQALVRLRQSRLMLGQDMERLERVFLHGDSEPDRVFLQQHHAGLNIISDQPLEALLTAKRPLDLQDGGLYLVDPLGNLIMYFAPDIAPGDMIDDTKHLLKLSRIG